MERQKGNFSLRGTLRLTRTLLLGVTLSVVVSGCGQLFQKSCQPASPPVRFLEDATWRLTYTNNPGSRYRQYDFIYTFEILSFDRQFGFQVKRVVRNRQFNAPIQQGNYDTDGNGTLVLRTDDPPASDGGDGGGARSSYRAGGTNEFQYSLGSKLELRDKRTGYIYRYHQFAGVVSPSIACVFK